MPLVSTIHLLRALGAGRRVREYRPSRLPREPQSQSVHDVLHAATDESVINTFATDMVRNKLRLTGLLEGGA